MTQVITIALDGTISGLQVKPGRGVDLTKMGKATVERVSEILWSEDAQAWYVQPIRGPFAGQSITHRMWQEVIELFDAPPGAKGSAGVLDQPIYFENYELAVKCEIAFLDAHRLAGKF